jgi:hypothetical protein
VTLPDTAPGPRVHRSRGRWVVLVGGLLALGATACSAQAAGPPPPPAAVTIIPPGTYRNAITPSGPQTLTIDGGTSYTQTNTASQQRIPGTIAQDSSQRVTFTSAAGAPCAGEAGLYKATVDGVGLHLTTVADPCPSRANDFVSGPWAPS